MPKLLLIRHGKTKLHKEDRFWGSTNIGLSEEGTKQAEQLGNRLSKEKISAVYASTLGRARATAEIIAAPHHREVVACPELCECNFGYIEGLTYAEIKKLYPALAEELDKRTAVAFPGGESLEQMNGRILSFLKKLEKHKPQDTIIIVAHGGPVRLIICNLLGLEIKHWQQLRIDLASLSIVDTYPAISYLNLLNDTSHLLS
jgi:alpha-ribazole phosphatase